MEPDSDGIMHAGDLTDQGSAEEYAEFRRIWREHGAGLPVSYFATGNHDVGLGHWPARLGAYLDATGMSGPYHDHWVNGYHFIFLGTEEGLELFASLSETQLIWLDTKLAESKNPVRPAFVFLHQPLKDTVAGSYESQRWYGVAQDEALKDVLAKHRHAILFTGILTGSWRRSIRCTMERNDCLICLTDPLSRIYGRIKTSIKMGVRVCSSKFMQIV